MAALKDTTMKTLEAMAGRRITYGSLSPSFLRYVEVRDLTIHDSSPSEAPLLTIRQVRVYYSLLKLLAGRDPASCIREIRLLNTRISIDLEKDADVVDLIRRLTSAPGTGQQGQLLARVTGANIGITVLTHGTTFSMDDLFFQVDAQGDKLAISLRGKGNGSLSDGFTFASSLKAQGSFNRSFTSSDLTLHFFSFDSSLISTGAETLQVVWNGNTVDVRKIQDRSPVEMEVVGDIQKQELTVDFATENVRLSRLFTFSGRMAKYVNWLKMPLTTSGHVTYRMTDKSLDYAVDLSAFLEDQLPIRAVKLDSSFHGTEKEIFFQPLRLSSDNGSAQFEGSILFQNFFPSGQLALVDVSAGSGEKMNAQINIDRAQGKLEVEGTHLSIGQLAFDTFHLTLLPLAGGASFDLSTSFADSPQPNSVHATGEVRFGQALGQIVSEGRPDPLAAPVVTMTATLSKVPPNKLYHLAMGGGALTAQQKDILAALASLSVTSELSLTTDFSLFSVESDSVLITRNDDPGTELRFGLNADTSHISVRDFSGAWKGFTLKGGFEGTFGSGGRMSFTSNVALLGSTYSLAGRYSPNGGLSATGSYGLAIAVAPRVGGGIQAHLQAERIPLPLNGATLPVSFDIAGQMAPDGSWYLDVPSLTLFDLPFLRSTKNTIQASGRLTAKRLDIRRLSFSDAFSTVTGSGGVDVALPADLLSPRLLSLLSVMGSVDLKAATGTEVYSLKGGLQHGALSLNAQFSGSPLSRIGESSIVGTLAGSASITGPLESPSVDVSIALKDGRLGTDPLSLSGQMSLTPGELHLRSVSAGFLGHSISDGTGVLNLKTSVYSFNGRYQAVYFADQIRLAFSLEGKYSLPPVGTGDAASLFDYGLSGKMSLSGITVAGSPVSSWSVSYRTTEGRLSLDGGPGNSVHGWINTLFEFAVSINDPMPLIGSVQGKITGDRIAAKVNVDSFDLPVLNAILKSPFIPTAAGPVRIIAFTSGVATGSISIDGAVNDPDFSGRLELVGGGVQSAYSPDEAGPIRTTIVFDGRTFHTEPFTTSAGPSRIDVQASFTIDHWSPLGFDISLTIRGQAPARVRAHFGRFVANGAAFGSIRIAGDDRKTDVTGSIVVSDCRMALGQAPQGKFIPEDPPTYVNLVAETGRRVEFYWPSEDVPVLRTMASSGGKFAITYRGDTGAYTIKGTTGVQGGEIYYFDRSFILKKGSIAFNEDQNTFDPWLIATAEVREWDPATGEEVKIYLDANSTLSKFSPRFSSDPSRSETQILAMIGAPILDRAESQGLGMAALVYSDILSQSWILRPFEQKVRELLNLDMFSLRTQIIQNWVAQKLGSTISPLDNTSMSLGKYIGNDLFLELLVRLQQQDLSAGASSTNTSLSTTVLGVQPDVELNLEWATPLFLLEWSFIPKHPEYLFLSDNSLSFSWKFSY